MADFQSDLNRYFSELKKASKNKTITANNGHYTVLGMISCVQDTAEKNSAQPDIHLVPTLIKKYFERDEAKDILKIIKKPGHRIARSMHFNFAVGYNTLRHQYSKAAQIDVPRRVTAGGPSHAAADGSGAASESPADRSYARKLAAAANT